MTTETIRADTPDQRRLHIEHLLARYPDLSGEELADLLTWVRTEASALDTGMLASDETLGAYYRRFRNDHLDTLGLAERIAVVVVAILLLAGIAAYAIMT
jgi:hypothetical protein